MNLERNDIGDPLVEVRNLTKVYMPSPRWVRLLLRTAVQDSVVALNDVSVTINGGTICAVVGPNGAGKSTLFRILTGLTTPSDGTASICGLDSTYESTAVRRLVGFMPAEDRTLFLRFSCVENLVFHGRLQGIRERELGPRVDEVLELVGLFDVRNRAGFALSSGMRARLQLARALVHRPRVLILDEPTGALDPVAAYEFLQILEDVAKEQNAAILVSSHRLEEIEALDDNVILLDRGTLIYQGDLGSLRRIWEKRRLEIRFENVESAVGACAALSRTRTEVSMPDPRTVIVTSGESYGDVLVRLNGHIDCVKSMTESRLPLRELLTQVLTREAGERPEVIEHVSQ